MHMKTIQSFSILLIFTLIVWGCSSSEPAPLNPSIPSLSFPINEETCLEGTSINDSQSSLEFRWNAAQNVESYRLDVKNLSTNQKQSFNTSR